VSPAARLHTNGGGAAPNPDTQADPDAGTRAGADPETAVPTARTASGVCQGALGELFQGPVRHQGRSGIGIVSFPVDRYAFAHFTQHTAAHEAGDAEPLPALPKAALGARLFLHRTGRTLPPGRWNHHTELDIGVGMASSTADIVATLRCLFQLFGLPYDPGTVTGILAQIERADSVFLDEFALYISDRHEVAERLGTAIGFHTCFIMEPGTVDTAEVTPLLIKQYQRRGDAYRACLDELLAAFRAGDAAAVARVSTTSAALSQEVLPKRGYETLIAHRRHFGAAGIFVAHTGSVIGYLFTGRLTRERMDELSAFFLGIGHQCHFAWGGYGSA
jgi:uncharacterized protein involved in propanediol utilization